MQDRGWLSCAPSLCRVLPGGGTGAWRWRRGGQRRRRRMQERAFFPCPRRSGGLGLDKRWRERGRRVAQNRRHGALQRRRALVPILLLEAFDVDSLRVPLLPPRSVVADSCESAFGFRPPNTRVTDLPPSRLVSEYWLPLAGVVLVLALPLVLVALYAPMAFAVFLQLPSILRKDLSFGAQWTVVVDTAVARVCRRQRRF
jgi:hypothetical protein